MLTRVKYDDVKIGDIFMVTHHRDEVGGVDWTDEWTVVALIGLESGGDCFKINMKKTSTGRVIERYTLYDDEQFTVKRPDTFYSDTKVVAKKIPEFPHFCPRCALPSYNGFNEVTHRSESMAVALQCPAPRK